MAGNQAKTEREQEMMDRYMEQSDGKWLFRVTTTLDNGITIVTDHIHPDEVAHKVKLDILSMAHHELVGAEVKVTLVPRVKEEGICKC